MAELPATPGADPGVSAAESLAVLRDSETCRLLQPARYGGGAVSRSTSVVSGFVAAIADLAEHDGSGGWFASAVNAAAYAVARLGDTAADRVWGADPAALAAVCGEPTGRLTAGRGQFRLTGRWESVTGAWLADWLLLSALDGDSVRYVLLPRHAVQVDRQPGLRGLDAAGIGGVAVSDANVDADAVFADPDDSGCTTGELDHGAPPCRILAGAGKAAAVVGAASAVWQAHVGQVRRRLATSYGSEDTTELAASAVLVAKAESDIDAARLQLISALSADPAAAATALRQTVTRARSAADQLLSSGSRHALDATDPVARLWLDVLAGYRLTIRCLGNGPGAG